MWGGGGLNPCVTRLLSIDIRPTIKAHAPPAHPWSSTAFTMAKDHLPGPWSHSRGSRGGLLANQGAEQQIIDRPTSGPNAHMKHFHSLYAAKRLKHTCRPLRTPDRKFYCVSQNDSLHHMRERRGSQYHRRFLKQSVICRNFTHFKNLLEPCLIGLTMPARCR